MTPTITGLVGIGILLIILFSRMPIGFGMGLVGFLGFAYLVGFGPALGLLKTVPYSTFSSHSLSVIPLFILMGSFAFSAGLSRDLYQAAYKWLGHLRGGLAMATVGACACFAAISGSSMATAATMGTVALPEMKKCNRCCGCRRKHGYPDTSQCDTHHLWDYYRTVHRQAVSGWFYSRSDGGEDRKPIFSKN